MKCPFCKFNDDRVIDSRSANGGGVIRRRRECGSCGKRYTTYERIEETPIRVIKKSGVRETFDRQKILAGVQRACEKRPVASETLEDIVDRIENEVVSNYDKEVPSDFIGEKVMQALKAIDSVAFVRFASVYRDFQDVSDFDSVVKPMLRRPIGAGRAPARK